MLAGVIGRMARRRGSVDDIEAALIAEAIAAAWDAAGNDADLGTVRTALDARDDRRAKDIGTALGPWCPGGATRKLSTRIETAVRTAAGLDAVLDEEHGELLRFVTRMAAAAEQRDLLEGRTDGAVAFPPLKRRLRSLPPDKAAAAWLARFRALAGEADIRESTPESPLTEGADDAALS